MKNKYYYIDLHIHTKYSDGERSLEETICDAKRAGLSAIAITDHNYFAVELPVMDDDLEIIPGAEFSTTYYYGDGQRAEVHIVGLFFDGVAPELKSVFKRINKLAYAEAIIEKMNSLGMSLTMEELKASNPQSKQFGRTQIADLLVEKGYATDRADAMDRWIGNLSPHFIHSLDHIRYIEMEECVREICKYGGFAILAHPFHYKFTKDQIEELVMRFRNAAERTPGMEVYYGKYHEEEVKYLEGLAKRYRLLPSAGSDRHKADHPFVKGQYELLEEMKKQKS